MATLPLTGKTAVVTGASRGIGAESARALDAAGARVVMIARSKDDLSAVAAGLDNDPVVLPADLAERDAPKNVAQQVLDAVGHVDILVNNAAAAARLPTADTDAEVIDNLLAVNVRAPLLLIASLVPAMVERGRGCIINLSSVSALTGTPRRAAYAASKGALPRRVPSRSSWGRQVSG